MLFGFVIERVGSGFDGLELGGQRGGLSLGFGVWGLGSRVEGFRIEDLGFHRH